MKTIKVADIKAGDVIMPPERELRLWMRRHAKEHVWSENSLRLTVTATEKIGYDKRGDWIQIRTLHDPEWQPTGAFKFVARPTSNWKLVRRGDILPMKTENDEIEVKVRISRKDYDYMVDHFASRARGRPLVAVIEYEHLHDNCEVARPPDGTDQS